MDIRARQRAARDEGVEVNCARYGVAMGCIGFGILSIDTVYCRRFCGILYQVLCACIVCG